MVIRHDVAVVADDDARASSALPLGLLFLGRPAAAERVKEEREALRHLLRFDFFDDLYAHYGRGRLFDEGCKGAASGEGRC